MLIKYFYQLDQLVIFSVHYAFWLIFGSCFAFFSDLFCNVTKLSKSVLFLRQKFGCFLTFPLQLKRKSAVDLENQKTVQTLLADKHL